MGVIQNSLNQLASTAMGAAVAGTASKMVKEQKAEQKFNAEMKQTELPVEQKKLALEAAADAKDKALVDTDKEYTKKAKDIAAVTKKITEKDPFKADRYEAIGEHKRKQAAAEAQEKKKAIKLKYNEEKRSLTSDLLAEQITAKKKQQELVNARVMALRGGNK